MKFLFNLRGNHKRRNTLMFVAFLSLSILLAAFIIGCDKQAPLGVDKPSQEGQEENVQTINLEPAKFSYRGQLYPKEEFQKMFKDIEFPIMVTGTGLPEENVVYVFDSEANFNTWANTTSFSEKLTKVRKLTSEAKQKAEVNSTLSVKRTTAPGGWVILFDGIFGGASWKFFVTGTWPNLDILNFNKKASSLELFNPPNLFPAFTICALYTSTSYRGSQIIFLNGSLNSKLKIDLKNYLFWSDQTQSLIVL